MNFSIFNFRSNTKEIRRIVSIQNALLGIFCIFFAMLVLVIVKRGIHPTSRAVIYSSIISLILILHKQYRKLYIIIISSMIIFMTIGELYFRINYFGIAAIRSFNSYVPAKLHDPFSAIEYDSRTYSNLKTDSWGRYKGKPFYINNLGFRDKNRPFEKTQGTIRVVVCGGSTSMGSGVAQDEVFAVQLEKILNDTYKANRFEVINFSLPGLHITHKIELLKEYGIPFDPDIIILANTRWHGNFKWPYLRARRRMSGKKNKSLNAFLSGPDRKLFFFKAITYRIVPNVNWILGDKRHIIKTLKNLFTRPGHKKKLQEKRRLARLERLDTRGKVSTKKYWITFHLDNIKTIANDRKVFIALISVGIYRGHQQVDPFLEKMCSDYNFGLINLYNKEELTSHKNMTYPGDAHPNAKIHRAFAESIFEHIKPEIDNVIKRQGRTITYYGAHMPGISSPQE